MKENIYYLIALGILLVAGSLVAVMRGKILLPKGTVITKAWPSRREALIVGLAFLFAGVLIGIIMSPYSSLSLIIGLGILFSVAIRLVPRKAGTEK